MDVTMTLHFFMTLTSDRLLACQISFDVNKVRWLKTLYDKLETFVSYLYNTRATMSIVVRLATQCISMFAI